MKEKRQHDNILNSMKRNNRGEQDRYSSGELSNYDNHPADLGSEMFETEHNMGLQVNEEYSIKEIDEALRRIEKGSYGICEFCGEIINKERLDIIPHARLCSECEDSKKLDSGYLKNSRPVEEKVLDAPFGRKYLNKQEDDEHEGMEQLNDVLKYGSADSPQDMGGYRTYKEYYTNKEDNQGIVEETDKVSNQGYKKQLE
jgi:YteA family regulatory protein